MRGLRHSLAWLAALLFALRAFLPTGFMPDPDALRAGRFQIIYCSAAGPMPAGMAMAGHHMAELPHAMHGSHPAVADGVAPHSARDMGGQGPAPDHSSMPADCPFGLTGSYTYTPPVVPIAAPALSLAWHMPAPPPFVGPLSGIVAGPPVGSRAPPYNLA